jgi:hypothetical protein
MARPSLTREAFLNDPDEVEKLAALPEPDGDWSPRISEWRLEHALMYDQRALLVSIRQLLEAKVTGKRPKPVDPLPAPRTLLDEVREVARRAAIDEMKHAFGYRPTD